MRRRLATVITDFSNTIKESRGLASDAQAWSIPVPPATAPLLKPKRRDALTELAFFRVFSAWEAFLEETFILYMLGQQAPRGRAVQRYGFPPTKGAAYEWVADGRPYAKWTLDDVRPRANRLFKGGRPYVPALRSHHDLLFQLKTLRNAIAHESANARTKFENLVRNQLGTLPPNTTPGSFLLTVKPRSAPPVSYLEFYFYEIKKVAEKIVPS